MRAIVILGAPGSGKSTIGRLLAESLGYKYVSTGDLARGLIKEGKVDDEWQLLGEFAPEEQILEAFAGEIDGHQAVIVDGMPRKVSQVTVLEKHFERIEYIQLRIDVDTAINRLTKRGRKDDQRRIIRHRMRKHDRIMYDVMARIEDGLHKTLIPINADRDAQEVVDIILGRIDI